MGTATFDTKCGHFFFFRSKYMSGIFEQTPANRRSYGVAIIVGIIAG